MNEKNFDSRDPYRESNENIKRDQEVLAWIDDKIRTLDAKLIEKRKNRVSNPESSGELEADASEIHEIEEELKELRNQRTSLIGGNIGAD